VSKTWLTVRPLALRTLTVRRLVFVLDLHEQLRNGRVGGFLVERRVAGQQHGSTAVERGHRRMSAIGQVYTDMSDSNRDLAAVAFNCSEPANAVEQRIGRQRVLALEELLDASGGGRQAFERRVGEMQMRLHLAEQPVELADLAQLD
jgi:hypothetical protein